MNKVVIVTGASSGIGFSTVKRLVADGYIVYGAARKKSDMKKIEGAGATALSLEMTDYSSLEKAVARVIKKEGRIDVLFNNAGYGLYGAIEDVSIDDAKQQFDVNLFGLARITQLVLPQMRKQKSGTIINTSSMAGKMYTPLGAWYHATKHALEGWSDCLRIELKQFGIDVVIVEPGAIKTPWGSGAADNIERTTSDGAYKKYGKKVARSMRNRYESNEISSPKVISDVVSKAISSSKPKTRYVAGKYAKPALFARKFLSDRMFDKIVGG